MAKLSKTDFHNVNAYRTVSLTAMVGKRYEKITSRRLLACIDEKGFDLDQYALSRRKKSYSGIAVLNRDN